MWGIDRRARIASGGAAWARARRMGARRRGRGRGRETFRRRWRWRSRRSFRGVVRVARRRARRARRDAVRRGRRGESAREGSAKEAAIQSSSRRGDGDGDVGAGGISRTSISPAAAAALARVGVEIGGVGPRGDDGRGAHGETVDSPNAIPTARRASDFIATSSGRRPVRVSRARPYPRRLDRDRGRSAGTRANLPLLLLVRRRRGRWSRRPAGAVCAKNSAVHAVHSIPRVRFRPRRRRRRRAQRDSRVGRSRGSADGSRRGGDAGARSPPSRRRGGAQTTGRAIERETEREVTRERSTPFASRRVVETRNLRERFFTVRLLARDESYAKPRRFLLYHEGSMNTRVSSSTLRCVAFLPAPPQP